MKQLTNAARPADRHGGRPADRSSSLRRRAEQLSLLIEQQIVPVFERRGIVVPVRSCPLLKVLSQLKVASAADLAKQLALSHQLVLQKMPALIRLGLVQRASDPGDRRRKVFHLTPTGQNQVSLIARHEDAIDRAYEDLHAEIGVDVSQLLALAIDALEARDLDSRIVARTN